MAHVVREGLGRVGELATDHTGATGGARTGAGGVDGAVPLTPDDVEAPGRQGGPGAGVRAGRRTPGAGIETRRRHWGFRLDHGLAQDRRTEREPGSVAGMEEQPEPAAGAEARLSGEVDEVGVDASLLLERHPHPVPRRRELVPECPHGLGDDPTGVGVERIGAGAGLGRAPERLPERTAAVPDQHHAPGPRAQTLAAPGGGHARVVARDRERGVDVEARFAEPGQGVSPDAIRLTRASRSPRQVSRSPRDKPSAAGCFAP